MILTDREIRVSLEQKIRVITPEPSTDAYQSTALDLTLDSKIAFFRDQTGGVLTSLDPSDAGYSYRQVISHLTSEADISGGYLIQPQKLILAWTREKISLPSQSRIAARVEGKSSLARIGLAIHVTAPTIHAGFVGPIQLEVVNHGSIPIMLRTGMRICQLIFEQTLGVPEKGYQGQFVGQGS